MSVVRYAIRNENGDYWKRGVGGWIGRIEDALLCDTDAVQAQCREILLWERRHTRRLTLVEVTQRPPAAAGTLPSRSDATLIPAPRS